MFPDMPSPEPVTVTNEENSLSPDLNNPADASILTSKKISVCIPLDGDVDIFITDCKTAGQFEQLKHGFENGYRYKVEEENGKLRLSVSKVLEGGQWQEIGEPEFITEPFLGDPLSISNYTANRNNSFSRLLKYASSLVYFPVIDPKSGKNNSILTSDNVFSSSEEMELFHDSIRENWKVHFSTSDKYQGPKEDIEKILNIAAHMNFSVMRVYPEGARLDNKEYYQVYFKRDGIKFPLGDTFSFYKTDETERPALLAQKLHRYLSYPPADVRNNLNRVIPEFLVNMHGNPALHQKVNQQDLQIIKTDTIKIESGTSTLELHKIEIQSKLSDFKTIEILVPKSSVLEDNLYLNHALKEIMSPFSSEKKISMQTFNSTIEYPIYEKLEPELYAFMIKCKNLGYEVVDAGEGVYALGRLRSDNNIYTDLVFSWKSAEGINKRGKTIQADFYAAEADEQKDASAQERLARLNFSERETVLAASRSLEIEDSLLSVIKGACDLASESLDDNELLTRALKVRYVHAFEDILLERHKEGDPSHGEIKSVSEQALDLVMTLYRSQQDSASEVPNFFKEQEQTNPGVKIRSNLEHLCMTAVNFVLEQRAKLAGDILITSRSRAIVLPFGNNIEDKSKALTFFSQFGLKENDSIQFERGDVLFVSSDIPISKQLTEGMFGISIHHPAVIYLPSKDILMKAEDINYCKRQLTEFLDNAIDYSVSRTPDTKYIRLDWISIVTEGDFDKSFVEAMYDLCVERALAKNVRPSSSKFPHVVSTNQIPSLAAMDLSEMTNPPNKFPFSTTLRLGDLYNVVDSGPYFLPVSRFYSDKGKPRTERPNTVGAVYFDSTPPLVGNLSATVEQLIERIREIAISKGYENFNLQDPKNASIKAYIPNL